MVTVIGMIAAFITGAVVRKPFSATPAKSRKTQESASGSTAEEIRLREQLNNLINYGTRRD